MLLTPYQRETCIFIPPWVNSLSDTRKKKIAGASVSDTVLFVLGVFFFLEENLTDYQWFHFMPADCVCM